MTLETSFIFVISLILLYIKPGPGQAAIVTRALNDGFFAGFCVATGITFGGALYFSAVALGIAFVQMYIGPIGFVFKIIGAIYLFYIGYQGLKNIESGQWAGRKDTANKREIVKNFTTGLLITLSNPFCMLYFIGILPSIVPLGELTAQDIVICLILLVYFGLLVDSMIAVMASQVRDTLSNRRVVKQVNLLTSIGFVLIGAFLLFSAIYGYNNAFQIQ